MNKYAKRFFEHLAANFDGRLVPCESTVYINSSTPTRVFDTLTQQEVDVIPDYIRRGIFNPTYRAPSPRRIGDHPALRTSPYGYGERTYTRVHDVVDIECPTHGMFSQKLSDHIYKGAGCPTCAGKARVSFDEFVVRARAVHGDLYKYDSAQYTTISSPTTIVCPTHGPWSTLAYNHTHNASGCPSCNKGYRHDPLDDGVLYLLRCVDLGCLKVGVSTPSQLSVRMTRHRKSLGVVELIGQRLGTVSEVLALESLLLQRCEPAPAHHPRVEGWTELIADSSDNIHLFTSVSVPTTSINVVPYSRARNRKWFVPTIPHVSQPFLHEVLARPHLFVGGPTKSLNARSATIRLCTPAEARAFYDSHHVQGSPQAIGTTYGLDVKGEIVMMMTVAPSRSARDKTRQEVIRLATRTGFRVRGGASKLFKHITSLLPPGTVVESYNDDRLFPGTVYPAMGMVFRRRTQPDYFWVKGDVVLKRSQSMRSKLPSLLGDSFDPTLSETRNMEAAGWMRIWGSGHTLYEYTCPTRAR